MSSAEGVRFALDERGRRQYTADGDAVLCHTEGSEFAVEWRHVSEAEPYGYAGDRNIGSGE